MRGVEGEEGPMLTGRLCVLRPYAAADVARLPQAIGSYDVVRWMSHRIPHPYTADDARAWVAHAGSVSPVNDFAIDVNGALAGGAGVIPQDGEHAHIAQIGYWIAPAFWGRGIATDATRTLAMHAFAERGMRRLTAWVFAPNVASAHVLERCGFTREGVMRAHVTERDGSTISDAFAYARLATDPEPPPA